MTAIDPDCEAHEATEADHRNERIKAVWREANAMHSAFIVLQPLDFNARRRALRWLRDALDNVEVPF
jgi:hypothetical protein